jgi:hypothetical protein
MAQCVQRHGQHDDAALEKNLEMLSDPIFLVSEILVNQLVETPVHTTEEAKPS